MKNKPALRLILGIIALGAVMLCCSALVPAALHAQAVPPDAFVLAQHDAPAAADAVAVTAPAAPWYLSTEFFAALFSLVAGAVAVIQNKEKTRAQKVNEVLVLGIEAATKIPKVVEFEKRIKGDIRAKAEELGVQPVLHRLVKDLTY